MTRDNNFSHKTIENVSKSAGYRCSNPECRKYTLRPASDVNDRTISMGEVAHIEAASEGGPRFNHSLTNDEISSPNNAIFLCAACATTIDKNGGVEFPVALLREWKNLHAEWLINNFNKNTDGDIVIVDGEHSAKGEGNIIGLEVKRGAIIKPGTIVRAEGKGVIIGTKIG